jgi:D-alanyl-D-alanine carboxypeptidase (penicillin-binding protein 5/6)
MMYALMLRSANDGCHTVAVHIAGSEAAFADMMNKRAKEIGCTNTTFVNPHGLTNPNHLTTPHDLALMAREAMKDPMFARVVGTQKHVVQRSLNLKDTLMENHDKWLWLDPRAKGVKTGWTKPAGHCFVGYATDNGMNVITVVMKSEAWIHDQQAMVDWAFRNFEPKTVCQKGEPAGRIDVAGGTADSVQVLFGEDKKLLVLKSAGSGKFFLDEEDTLQAPVVAGTVVHQIDFSDGLTTVQIPVVASVDVPKRSLVASLATPGGIIGFVALSAGALLVKARSRKMSGGYSVRER